MYHNRFVAGLERLEWVEHPTSRVQGKVLIQIDATTHQLPLPGPRQPGGQNAALHLDIDRNRGEILRPPREAAVSVANDRVKRVRRALHLGYVIDSNVFCYQMPLFFNAVNMKVSGGVDSSEVIAEGIGFAWVHRRFRVLDNGMVEIER